MQRLSSSSPNLAQSTRDALMELLNEPALRERLEQACPAAYCDGELKLDLLMEEMGKYADLGDEERYEFRWNGKQRAKLLAQKPSTCTLRPCPEESKNWDTTQNLYIEGDNLEVLKILQRAYSGKIKMIYIDPPYNTRHDFVYKDDFSDSLTNYLKQTGAVDDDGKLKSSNTVNDGRYHTNWLNMMYPRLRLAKNLLTEDGVIFISIDDNEQANLKKLCDEVFGSENFVGQWNWFKSATPANLSNKIKKNIEYVFCYEQNKDSIKYKGIIKESASNNGLLNQTNSVHKLIFPENIVNTNLPDGIYKKGKYGTDKYDIILHNDVGVKNGYFITKIILEGKFKWSQDYLDTQIKNGTLISIKSKAFSPSYEKLEYDPEVPPNFISLDVGANTTEQAGSELNKLFNNIKVFDFPKDIGLLKYVLSFKESNAKDSIILDFFSGSATTAHAVMQLNAEDGGKRKFIMVQLPEVCDAKSEAAKAGYKNICEIGKERIRRAGEKIKADNPLTTADLDIGFKVFKLADSNMNKWKLELADLSNKSDVEKLTIANIMAATNTIRRKEIEEENEQRSAAGLAPFDIDLCVVYEWLLKYGVQLDKRVEVATVAGKRVYTVSGGAFMICLDEGLDQNWAQALVAERDKRIGSLGATTVSDMWHVMVADASFTANNLLNVEHYLTANGLKGEHFIVV